MPYPKEEPVTYPDPQAPRYLQALYLTQQLRYDLATGRHPDPKQIKARIDEFIILYSGLADEHPFPLGSEVGGVTSPGAKGDPMKPDSDKSTKPPLTPTTDLGQKIAAWEQQRHLVERLKLDLAAEEKTLQLVMNDLATALVPDDTPSGSRMSVIVPAQHTTTGSDRVLIVKREVSLAGPDNDTYLLSWRD